MKKQDLKTGMRVTTRESTYIVLLNCHIVDFCGDIMYDVNGDGYVKLSDYSVDDLLITNGDSKFDIIKVEVNEYFSKIFIEESWKTIWERKETKELTVAQVEELLGYKVKIVK